MAVGIIYGAESGIPQRVVVSDDGKSLDHHVRPGEAIAYTDLEELGFPDSATPPDPNRVEQIIAQAIGREPEPGRCRLINDESGETVGFIMADPRLCRIEGHTVFQDAHGGWDWLVGPNGWEAPPETAE